MEMSNSSIALDPIRTERVHFLDFLNVESMFLFRFPVQSINIPTIQLPKLLKKSSEKRIQKYLMPDITSTKNQPSSQVIIVALSVNVEVVAGLLEPSHSFKL